MSKLRTLLVCWIILSGSPAVAQPLFETEHDWRVQIGGAQYGIVQRVQLPGEFRSTTVHFGSKSHRMHCTAYQLVGLAALPLIVGIGTWMFLRRRPSEAPQ